MKRTTRYRLALAGLTLALALVGGAAVARPGLAAQRSQVAGTVAPGLADASRLGDASPNSIVSLAISLPLRNAASLDSFIAAVSNPTSPLHGHYLTPTEFTQLYGPTAAQVATVTAYLEGQGLTVTAVAANREVIDVKGSLAAAARAFGTSIGRYHDAHMNRTFIANDSAVSLPASVAPDILGVAGLNNHYPPRHSRAQLRAQTGGGPAGGYTPAQLKTAYDVNPLATAGYAGSGQTVGLFELAPFCQTDISTYDTQYSLTPPAPTSVSVDSGSTACPTTAPASGEDEAEFDIEVIQAIAPAAGITVWVGPDPAHASETNVLHVYNAMVTSDTTRTNSTSWGDCEQDLSPSFRQSEENIFKQAAAQGQSFFAASGDYGNIDCYPSTGSFKLAVNDPAADPYVTGVGGTTLNLTGSNAYSSETTWNGSGGGLSVVWPRPAWQTGPGVAKTYSNGKRQVPDVALDADPNTGYSVYIEAGPYVDTSQDIGWAEIGGTSGGAPAWAAFAALLNQDAVANHKPTLGFANPTLYENQRSNGQFHDVTSGNNDLSGSYGGKYPATAGWDFATGWGSFDANVLAGDLLANVGTDNASVVFNGQPHDWYYDSTFHALRHAVWNGSGWQLETLDGAGSGGGGGRTTDSVGRFNAALVYSGQMNNFYYDISMGALRHAWFDGAWHFETLDGPGCVYAGCGTHSVGQFSAVTLYGNSIQVFYYDATSHAMRHAWWTGSSWNYETLDGSGSGGGSGRTTTDDAGQYNAVTVYGNQVQVYYYDVTSHALRHAWWDTVRWNFETLDGSGSSGGGGRTTTDTVGWNSGVTTYGNQLQIWYYDATTDALRHAWWDTVRWNFEVLDGSGAAGGNGRTTDHVGQYGAVTLYGGLPHVWYLDSDGQSLRHGWWDGGAWRFETLDGLASSYSGHTTDHVGQFNTVAPLSGQLWVWHFDATGSTLRNALWTGSVWQFTTIDS